ncbi:hypothetical protein KUTeg_001405 [Tegillarca granosa]|uniref:Disintegrin domain-containing protein n=1 Tax=Tegillarca granosa TaxID=220873 RepID=A0ABQ9FRC3_TEGGR|nr:hypothetical protein KUTeg_001405 [Tegillarca granosa]
MDFSPCSRRFIYRVLQMKAYDCFKKPTAGQSLCGNGRRDNGEECDPGEATDYCCTDDCTLQPNAECSDLNYACCKQCKRAPRGIPCRSELDDNVDCKEAAVCEYPFVELINI